MTNTLVLPDSIASALRDLAHLEVETGGVLLARAVYAPNGDLRLLGREFLPVPEEAYERRRADELLITSDGFVPALRRAESTETVPIWLHTHPGEGSSPRPSVLDNRVDYELNDLFRLRSGSEFYGSAIVSHAHSELRFTGLLDRGDSRLEIDRLLSVGPGIALAWNDRAERGNLSSLFDRNIRAFGEGIQRALHDLNVAVVGCGGTGSSVAEQLVRLGVRHLILIDPDDLTGTNLTRTYGSYASDVGQPKVEVLARHLIRIAPDAHVESLVSSITIEATAKHLIAADVVFGCTDDNAGRLVLSRLATFMITPVIDVGVLLSSDCRGVLDGIHGRVTVLHPGAACLVCRNRIDLARAGSEMLTPGERARRVDEGYAPALPGVEPAVVAYTTAVAAYAVGELLERMIRYGPNPSPSEVLLRIHDREISVNHQQPRPNHYCDPAAGKLGLGLTEPFLEQVWSK